MQRSLFVVVMTVLLLTCCRGARAEAGFVDGNKLVTYLREFEKSERNDPSVVWEGSGIFEGYVVAIADSADVCSFKGVPVKQVEAVVAKYLNDHPSDWNKPAAVLVRIALREAFCK